MRKRILQLRRHLESQRSRPGNLGDVLVGCACCFYYEYSNSRRNDKRFNELDNEFIRRAQLIIDDEINELYNEFIRRAQVIIDGKNEIIRQISGGKANESSRKE